MLIDIHTHRFPTGDHVAIYNVPMIQADVVFSSNIKGYFSVGFHPWLIDAFAEEMQEKMTRWADDKRLIAIGECGLDKNSKVCMEKQIVIFEKQVKLSEEKQKPLIIHCVGRFNELFDLKKQWNPRQAWIIHGFRGKPQLAEQALNTGCYLSFGEHFNPESVLTTPLENLLLETDESKLSIEQIYQKVADTKMCPVERLTAGKTLLKSKI